MVDICGYDDGNCSCSGGNRGGDCGYDVVIGVMMW